MRSLRSRILTSASLVLVVFLGCAGLLLDRAFREAALDGVEDRLRGRIFMLIGAADFDAAANDALVGTLPDPSLTTPGSGHYASISGENPALEWRSSSLLGQNTLTTAGARAGQWSFEDRDSAGHPGLFALTYGIIWEGDGERPPRRFMLRAFEDDQLYAAMTGRFRRSLLLWFSGLSVVLLLLQAVNLNRGLRPLMAVGDEVRAIEGGRQDHISGSYPVELHALTQNLNRLLRHNRDSIKRYRNSLGDLAHSIKTPLSILRNEIGGRQDVPSSREVSEQIERIDRTVQYYLQRSSAVGRAALSAPLRVAPIAIRVADSLRKVYAGRDLEILVDVDEQIAIAADEGDLMEIIGNLADNACKWARSRVRIVATDQSGDTGRLILDVIDDGPGIANDQLEQITRRGARLDESVEGHGIGLAIVRELVEQLYGGEFSIRCDGGGTVARVVFAP